jgi:hypothetical protein
VATIERREVPIAAHDGEVFVGVSEAIDLSQCINKGFDFIGDALLTFVGRIEGSVAGQNWTLIANLAAADQQAAIPAQYNYVRFNCTVLGVKGVTTRLNVAGVNQ